VSLLHWPGTRPRRQPRSPGVARRRRSATATASYKQPMATQQAGPPRQATTRMHDTKIDYLQLMLGRHGILSGPTGTAVPCSGWPQDALIAADECIVQAWRRYISERVALRAVGSISSSVLKAMFPGPSIGRSYIAVPSWLHDSSHTGR
jgi:hypothetical protein